jgi:hypothetical protein
LVVIKVDQWCLPPDYLIYFHDSIYPA